MGYSRGIDELTTKELKDELARRKKAKIEGLCSYCGRKVRTVPPCRFPDRHREGLGYQPEAGPQSSPPGNE